MGQEMLDLITPIHVSAVNYTTIVQTSEKSRRSRVTSILLSQCGTTASN